LELRGYTTSVAYSGTEGLEKAFSKKPHIILLDIGLPDMHGYEVARQLKEGDSPAYLIALTGYGQAEDRERAKQAGFNDHLTKPAGLKEIEAALKKIPKSRT
jgi:CheY-like chemotaxis protein